jgi:ATP-dependent Clp protease ATP-binding subunit ClpB
MHPYHEEPNGDIAPKVRDAVMDVVQSAYAPECKFDVSPYLAHY